MPYASELLWSVLLFAIIGAGAVLITLVARACRKPSRNEQPASAFTIQDLREMREAGSITQEEFQVMRAAVISQVSAKGAAPPSGPATASGSTDTADDENGGDENSGPPDDPAHQNEA